MKLFSALAIVASSVNATCDWDLTKPIAHSGPYKGSGSTMISEGIGHVQNFFGDKDSFLTMKFALKEGHKGTTARCDF